MIEIMRNARAKGLSQTLTPARAREALAAQQKDGLSDIDKHLTRAEYNYVLDLFEHAPGNWTQIRIVRTISKGWTKDCFDCSAPWDCTMNCGPSIPAVRV